MFLNFDSAHYYSLASELSVCESRHLLYRWCKVATTVLLKTQLECYSYTVR